MTANELLSLLTLSGHPVRLLGDEVALRDCWHCGNDRWNLELNAEKGVFSCWNCRESGRLDALLTEMRGEHIYIPVRLDAEPSDGSLPAPAPSFKSKPADEILSASNYLIKRGLDPFHMRNYQLIVCLEPGHLLEGRICFPIQDFWSGNSFGYMGRAYVSGKRPKYLTNAPRKLIGGYRTRDRSRPCIIVEGFFDGIAVHRAGFQTAILLGIDSKSVEEFASRLPAKTPLLILLDGSAEKEASRLFWTIKPIRQVQQLSLPSGIDPGELHPAILQQFISQKGLDI